MYILTYLYILAEISAYHLQLRCIGGHFFSGPSLLREHSDKPYPDILYYIMLEPNIKDTGGMINVLYIAREG